MGVRIGLVYDQVTWEIKAILETAKFRGVKVNLIDSKTNFFKLNWERGNASEFGDVILQRCLSYFRGLNLTAILESMGYTVVNSYRVSEICGNKLLTTLVLSKAGVPTPETYVAFTPQSAVAALDRIGYPAVLKPVVGSWGRMIVPLNDRDVAEAILKEREYMHPLHQIYYIQKRVEKPFRDIRVIVVGEEAVATMYRYSFRNFKTNVARDSKTEACRITPELRELALKAADAVGGGILGVDIMESRDGLVVHEVNHNVEFRAAASTTGVNIPKYIIGYLLRKAKK